MALTLKNHDGGSGPWDFLFFTVPGSGLSWCTPSAFLRKNTQSKRQRERNWRGGGRRVVYVSIFKLTVSQEIHYRGKDGKLKERSKE